MEDVHYQYSNPSAVVYRLTSIAISQWHINMTSYPESLCGLVVLLMLVGYLPLSIMVVDKNQEPP